MIPNSHENGSNYAFTASNITSAYHNSANTTYARLQLAGTANRVYDIFFNFNTAELDTVPSGVTITSLTCKVKYQSSTTGKNGVSALEVRAYSGNTAKGTANTSNSTSASARTINMGGVSAWTLDELRNARIYIKATNGSGGKTPYVYVYGADITITYSGTITEYDITASDTASNGMLRPTGTISKYEGLDTVFSVTSDYLNRIYLKDNNAIVNNALVHTAAVPSTTSNFTPISFDSSNSVYDGVYSTSYPIDNGFGNETSSTEARPNTIHGAGAETFVYYNFNCLGIPSHAIIDSVTCTVKGSLGAVDNAYFTDKQFQLCTGTTRKGSGVTITSTTPTTYTISNGGTWTIAELDDAKILLYAKRGSSNTTSTYYFRFYGARLVVTYHCDECYLYTIAEISADHTLVLQDRPTYQITASASATDTSVSPMSATAYEGNDLTLSMIIPNLSGVSVTDNNTDVTSSLSGSGTSYTYTLSNIVAAHTILISDVVSAIKLYLKENGVFRQVSKIFRKTSGAWTEVHVEDLTDHNVYIKK